jgi:hypothetical protein
MRADESDKFSWNPDVSGGVEISVDISCERRCFSRIPTARESGTAYH